MYFYSCMFYFFRVVCPTGFNAYLIEWENAHAFKHVLIGRPFLRMSHMIVTKLCGFELCWRHVKICFGSPSHQVGLLSMPIK